MQKISTLIFDLGNVIIDLKPDPVWHAEDLLPNFNAEKLHQYHADLFFNDYETGKLSSADFVQKIKEIAHDAGISDDTIMQHWNGILLDIPKHRIDLLYELKQKYTLILLSNTNDIHLEFIINYLQEQFGKNSFDEIFTHQFYSQKMGLRKPNKDIYEFVIEAAGIVPNEAYFFDDKPENLIEAKNLGINTVLVDRDIFLQDLRLFL